MKGKTYSNNDLLFDTKKAITPLRHKSDKMCIKYENFFKKKIKFDSAFDHKGSKQFLDSKKLALQQIIIEDDFSNNESDTRSESNKQKKKMKIKHPKTTYIKHGIIKAKSSNNIFILDNNIKDSDIKKSKHKGRNSNLHIIKTLVTKELNVTKKIKQFFSSQELKMFSDKQINKIKPIKIKENDIEDKDKNMFFPFVESDNADKNVDSSILQMVTEIK